ncbi:TetR/AcrR family transcriptional regulator [Pseudobacteriovorax antillogorgiicola]|uniref:Transcriptional regulator, TetR family n=1 Tax=Pseudobacteriovorax antillogorgiicola TaxID=1513793 RepID=A0A1Y6BPP9_9BACT|nr:TetR/AcrR family transcriptional regulator [Pseudobacteriovorax antillogorgiicola]TCS53803.1 TetR family transcriptional regulator [Pseudobacteriovorax antillogorgiicola]SMF22103.1 transcriptional regulator, TetR family [Pseudobacteriovorax antillogorgiicola]
MTKPADTKEKIIDTACQLFATSGFHGVSIREIAKEAGVNLAAVNYHFKNKEGLFAAILIRAKLLFNKEVEALNDGKINAFEFAISIRDVYAKHSDEFRNGFALFLQGEYSEIVETVYDSFEEMGPPGQQVLKDVFQREIPDIGPSAAEWGAQTLLKLLAHDAMFVHTTLYGKACSMMPEYYNEQTQHIFTEEMVRSVINHLTNHHQDIEARFKSE